MRILNSPAKTNGGNGDRKNLDTCTIVIFGASGDLTARKLIPALYHLFKEKQMPATFRVIGFARREVMAAGCINRKDRPDCRVE